MTLDLVEGAAWNFGGLTLTLRMERGAEREFHLVPTCIDVDSGIGNHPGFEL